MSRWNDQYNNHGFWAKWETFEQQLEDITIEDENIERDLEELTRARKVSLFVRNLIDNADPEFVTVANLDNFDGRIAALNTSLSDYKKEPNYSHLKTINSTLDAILTTIRPQMIRYPISEEAMNDIYKKYSSKLAGNIRTIGNSTKKALDALREARSLSASELKEINQLKVDAKNVLKEISTGEDSIKTQSEKALKSIKSIEEDIDELNSWLFEDDGEADGLSNEARLKKQISTTTEKAEEFRELVEETDSELEKVTKVYTKIFGDADSKSPGLLQSLEDSISDFNDYQETTKSATVTLREKLEELIPGATTVNMSSKFETKQDSYFWTVIGWNVAFFLFIASMVGVSALPEKWLNDLGVLNEVRIEYVNSNESAKASLANQSKPPSTESTPKVKEPIRHYSPDSFWKMFLFKLSLLSLLGWGAYYSSKRRSEAARLREEYSHKSVLAQSYMSFKREIDELDDDDPELKSKLLETLIMTVGLNASTTLSKKHGDNSPFLAFFADKFGTKDKSKSEALS